MPEGLEVTFGNYMEFSDDELLAHLDGVDALVFAAGIDERIEGPPPVYDMFARFNIAPLDRLLGLAKRAGVGRAVVYGSYFSHFDKTMPSEELSRWHPYIRSRRDQERMALSHATDGFSVAVLELPYIFGAQPGRNPVWVFLVEMLRGMPGATLYPRGGTTMVTVRQVAQATAGAAETVAGGVAYPIGWFNLTWREMLAMMHRHLGLEGRRVVTVPSWLVRMQLRAMRRQQARAGHEGGLEPVRFLRLQTAELFIDKEAASVGLGVTDDDLDAAIGESMRACLEVLDDGADAVEMRGE